MRFNACSFDRGVLEEVTLQHLYSLDNPLEPVTLVDVHDANKKQRAALSSLLDLVGPHVLQVGKVARVRGNSVAMGDVVAFLKDGAVHVGDVYIHARVDGHFLTCIVEWQVVERPRPFVARCLVVQKPSVVSTSCLMESLIHCRPAAIGDVAQVLLPRAYW